LYADDTLAVLQFNDCGVLEKNLVEFSGVLNKNQASLHWRVNQNEQINSFTVEYSLDRSNFELLNTLAPNEEYGVASYSATHDLSGIYSGIVYYRLRFTGQKWPRCLQPYCSHSVKRRNTSWVTVYPNPSVAEKIFASVMSGRITNAEYIVTDVNSKIISRKKIILYAGNNTIALSELDNSQPGAYFIKMVTEGNTFIQKIIISK
jgi:hypothetical protein